MIELLEEPPQTKAAKPLALEGPQLSEDDEYRRNEPLGPLQNKRKDGEEEDKQNREIERGIARDYSRYLELKKPPREEIQDRNNTFCHPCPPTQPVGSPVEALDKERPEDLHTQSPEERPQQPNDTRTRSKRPKPGAQVRKAGTGGPQPDRRTAELSR